MKLFYIVLLTALLTSCDKSPKEAYIATDPEQLNWLNAKKAEYQSCICLTGIRQGIYNNEPVFEIYGFDPLCNTINSVYKTDGTIWFLSSNQVLYADYTANVKDQRTIWTCSR